MPVSPKPSIRRPLLEKDILRAIESTKSAQQAARYLNVSYTTFKRYAQIYGLFKQSLNPGGKGIKRSHKKGHLGLDDILAGKHPYYDKTRLKSRLVAAGYLEEACSLCGFKQKRVLDGRCPLVLACKDGDDINLRFDNLHLKCYNCVYLTSGRVSEKHIAPPEAMNQDIVADGKISMDDIERIQREIQEELGLNE